MRFLIGSLPSLTLAKLQSNHVEVKAASIRWLLVEHLG